MPPSSIIYLCSYWPIMKRFPFFGSGDCLQTVNCKDQGVERLKNFGCELRTTKSRLCWPSIHTWQRSREATEACELAWHPNSGFVVVAQDLGHLHHCDGAGKPVPLHEGSCMFYRHCVQTVHVIYGQNLSLGGTIGLHTKKIKDTFGWCSLHLALAAQGRHPGHRCDWRGHLEACNGQGRWGSRWNERIKEMKSLYFFGLHFLV